MTIYSLDALFSYLKPVCWSMFSSNCCFLTCIQISQEAGQMVWYSQLFKNFPQFIVINTVKGLGRVSKTFFWNSLAFSIIQQMLAVWSLVPLPFLNPAWISESSWFMYCRSLAWRILSITLLVYEMSAIVGVILAFFGIAFLRDWNENWPFPVLWPLLSFTNLLAYWVQHFHSIFFRVWNSSTGISSPPLALFTAILPKAHLT